MFRKKKKVQITGDNRRVNLSTGGFVEIEQEYWHVPGSGYVRIHLRKPAHPHDLDETFKYVRYGHEVDNLNLLIELRDALITLVESNTYGRKFRNLPPVVTLPESPTIEFQP